MTPAARGRSGRSWRFRAVALVALASLSCATVRVPASGIPGSVKIREDVAEPQIELWVESGREVTPAEAARAAADARAALEQALAGRTFGDGGQLLVVRAQGVSRTGSRKADQTAAAAGLAVAAVAIVAVAVVVLVAAGKGRGRSPTSHAAPAAASRPAPPPAVAPPPVATPASVPRPAPPAGARPPLPPPARPAPGPSGGGVGFAIGANVQVGVPAPEGPPPAVWGDAVVAEPPPAPEAPIEPVSGELALPPPPPLDVERRGFFARDATRLEVTVVDRATMTPLWVKVVESKDDPRDAGAVRALLDRALSDPGGWEAPAGRPAPPEM